MNGGNAQVDLQRSALMASSYRGVGEINLEEIANRSLLRKPNHSGFFDRTSIAALQTVVEIVVMVMSEHPAASARSKS